MKRKGKKEEKGKSKKEKRKKGKRNWLFPKLRINGR